MCTQTLWAFSQCLASLGSPHKPHPGGWTRRVSGTRRGHINEELATITTIKVTHCYLDINATPANTERGLPKWPVRWKDLAGGSQPHFEDQSEQVNFFLANTWLRAAFKSPGPFEYLERKGCKSMILAGLSTFGYSWEPWWQLLTKNS